MGLFGDRHEVDRVVPTHLDADDADQDQTREEDEGDLQRGFAERKPESSSTRAGLPNTRPSLSCSG